MRIQSVVLLYALALALGFVPGCKPVSSGSSLQAQGDDDRKGISIICGAPNVPLSWESPDTVGVLLSESLLLWRAEERAFYEYEASFCRECDELDDLRREFFGSSTAFLSHIGLDYPEDPRAQCAWGEAVYRASSLGWGEFDQAGLREAIVILNRAMELSPSTKLRSQISRLLEVANSALLEPE